MAAWHESCYPIALAVLGCGFYPSCTCNYLFDLLLSPSPFTIEPGSGQTLSKYHCSVRQNIPAVISHVIVLSYQILCPVSALK